MTSPRKAVFSAAEANFRVYLWWKIPPQNVKPLMIEVCYRFLLKLFSNGFPLQQIVFISRESDLKKRLISPSPHIRTLTRNNFFPQGRFGWIFTQLLNVLVSFRIRKI